MEHYVVVYSRLGKVEVDTFEASSAHEAAELAYNDADMVLSVDGPFHDYIDSDEFIHAEVKL